GTLLGAAIGCRLTSGMMIIPLSLFLARSGMNTRWSAYLVRFYVATSLVGALLYIPVVSKYGWDFWRFNEEHGWWLFGVIKLATVDVWGTIGLLAIAVGVLSLITRLQKSTEITAPISLSRRDVIASITTVVLYGVGYLQFPTKAAYLIPA